MQDIRLSVVGRIVQGEELGWYVKLEYDGKYTGGYYIFKSQHEDFSDGYDAWVETREELERYVLDSNWEIEWLDE